MPTSTIPTCTFMPSGRLKVQHCCTLTYNPFTFLLNWFWNVVIRQCVTFRVGRTRITASCRNSTPNVASSYGQVLSRVQVDHQQGRGQAVVGQASVCAHAAQHLSGRRGRSNRVEFWFSAALMICECRTCSSFSGVESKDSHSSFRWSFPVDVSSRSNHCCARGDEEIRC